MPIPPQPWTPAQATDLIRQYAKDDSFDLHLTEHVKIRLEERGLIIGDALHVMKNGFIYENPEPATRNKHYKYSIECKTPNSGARSIRLVIIPSPDRPAIKIVTIMWVDE